MLRGYLQISISFNIRAGYAPLKLDSKGPARTSLPVLARAQRLVSPPVQWQLNTVNVLRESHGTDICHQHRQCNLAELLQIVRGKSRFGDCEAASISLILH